MMPTPSPPVALIAERAGPSLECWVECAGDERVDCPDCEGCGRYFFAGRTIQCDGCHGDARFSLRDALDIFSPADFGLRRDPDGTIYRDVNHDTWRGYED